MTLQPVAILVSFAMMGICAPVGAQEQPRAHILLAQAADSPGPAGPAAVPSDAGSKTGTPVTGAPAAGAIPTPTSPGTGASPQGASATGSAANPPAAARSPAPTTATRNGNVAAPTPSRQGATGPGTDAPSISYGGPQVDTQPIYGSTLRDNGAGNGGVPTYSNAPSTLGGPINGTANPYYSTLPNGAGSPGQTTSTSRNPQAPNGDSYANRQPLGARPYTRDQGGTLGGTTNGYNAQGIYNGTAAQTGVGYGSPYAGNGRPTGGLLSTGVDATGPLRPYIPLNNSPSGRPNSGYGIPNGSRSTHMDGRGVQRLD